jgi:hypothetical protein
MKHSSRRVYEIEQQKLLLDFEKIALFTDHPTSLGTFRESRLRQYLRDFTPRQLSLGTGFVSSFEHGDVLQSKQIDCLVFDETRTHPELRTDDYVIVRPEAFYAAIEIKSELTFYKKSWKSGEDKTKFPLQRGGEQFQWAGTLIEALVNIQSIVQTVGEEAAKCFFGVFGYQSSFLSRTLAEALDNDEIQKQLKIKHINELPRMICIPGKCAMNLSPYDFAENAHHHDPYISFLNVLEAQSGTPAYPLQFFTTYYLNQIGAKLSGKLPKNGGLNSASTEGETVKIWRQHFDLNSEGFEDQ